MTAPLLLSSQTKRSPLLLTAIPAKLKPGASPLLPKVLMSCLCVLNTDTLPSFPLLTYTASFESMAIPASCSKDWHVQ